MIGLRRGWPRVGGRGRGWPRVGGLSRAWPGGVGLHHGLGTFLAGVIVWPRWLGLVLVASAAPSLSAQGMATSDRIQAPGFWPTKGTPAREEFRGPDACTKCHAGHARQATTSMARTATRAADSVVLSAHESLSVSLSGYEYQIRTRDGQSLYSVAKDGQALTLPLGWAFGVGKVGQTYVYEREGRFYESRVSYLHTLASLGFTPARALAAPRDVEEAAGRPVGGPEARRCFGCHMTASATEGALDLPRLIPGITCEACHGPGARHVAAAETGRLEEARHAMINPRRFDATTSVDFCGACHSSWWDVTLAGEKGIAALRSQPFRLQSSRCWGDGDARLTCVACHDPHEPLVRDPLAYDARCLGCHGPSPQPTAASRPATHPDEGVAPPSRTGLACKVATENCTTCHMPKYEVPEMHFEFTDHLIRVVRGKN